MMRLRRFRRNNKGISTIIASALIVAMTVIAAVALGSTVLQMPSETRSIPHFSMTGTASISDNEIKLTHTGGDTINTGTITFKTYITDGTFKDYTYEIPNVKSSAYDGTYGQTTMHLLSDIPEIYDYPPPYGKLTSYKYAGYGLDSYQAPMQAGDTLVIDFRKSFGTATGQLPAWADQLMAPKTGEQFTVELYSGDQIIHTIPITVEP